MKIIIRNKLVSFLEENILIRNALHGFRHKYLFLRYLLDFYNNIFKIYDEKKAVDITYLEFQKAFDKVPHKRLLNKSVT